MSRTKQLLEQLKHCKKTNKHDLGTAHWDACIQMAEQLRHEELIYQLKETTESLKKRIDKTK